MQSSGFKPIHKKKKKIEDILHTRGEPPFQLSEPPIYILFIYVVQNGVKNLSIYKNKWNMQFGKR